MTGWNHMMSRSQSGLIGVILGAVSILLAMGGASADKLDDIKARGRLIVGVTESSPPFSYRDGENGIVVAPGDAGSLRDAISTLVGDAPLRAQLGAPAREAVAPYTYDAMADAFSLALATAIRPSPTGP